MDKREKIITILLQDGDLKGRIMCCLDYGAAVMIWKIPREMLLESEDEIKEMKYAGVYFLLGNLEGLGDPVFYVGQAGGRNLITRLKEHNKSKEYWTEAIILTTSDNSLGATDVTYLEHKFYKLAKKINRVDIQNRQEPNKGNVLKRDEIKGNSIIGETKLLMHFLGYKVFEPLSKEVQEFRKNIKKRQEEEFKREEIKQVKIKIEEKKDFEEECLSGNKKKLYLKSVKKNNYSAVAEYDDGEYTVLKGSKISSNISKPSFHKISNLRKNYAKELPEDFILTENIAFNSSSSAAQFVVGYSVNGSIVWKNKEGKTVKELGLKSKKDNK